LLVQNGPPTLPLRVCYPAQPDEFFVLVSYATQVICHMPDCLTLLRQCCSPRGGSALQMLFKSQPGTTVSAGMLGLCIGQSMCNKSLIGQHTRRHGS
jgi:hypothetical protein